MEWFLTTCFQTYNKYNQSHPTGKNILVFENILGVTVTLETKKTKKISGVNLPLFLMANRQTETEIKDVGPNLYKLQG